MLERDDVDLVDICTPEFLHAEQTIAAAAAGKHVHCEKPMAASVAEADAMIDACRRAGVRLMVGHSRRFTPRYRQIKAAIDSGEVGSVLFVREIERRAVRILGRTAGTRHDVDRTRAIGRRGNPGRSWPVYLWRGDDKRCP